MKFAGGVALTSTEKGKQRPAVNLCGPLVPSGFIVFDGGP